MNAVWDTEPDRAYNIITYIKHKTWKVTCSLELQRFFFFFFFNTVSTQWLQFGVQNLAGLIKHRTWKVTCLLDQQRFFPNFQHSQYLVNAVRGAEPGRAFNTQNMKSYLPIGTAKFLQIFNTASMIKPWTDRPTTRVVTIDLSHKSHNAPFCNRNVHMCAHFCYKMMHCGIFDALWDLSDGSTDTLTLYMLNYLKEL